MGLVMQNMDGIVNAWVITLAPWRKDDDVYVAAPNGSSVNYTRRCLCITNPRVNVRFWRLTASGASHRTRKNYVSSSFILSLLRLLLLSIPLAAGTFAGALPSCSGSANILVKRAVRPRPPMPATIPVMQATLQRT